MERVGRFFANLLNDDGYFGFQKGLADAMYTVLRQGYASNENEIQLVHRLAKVTNGMSYGRIHLHSEKIHGSTSLVQFSHQGRAITKELADSVFITVVTAQRRRLVQRVCFVSHKKAHAPKKRVGRTWDIDAEQLYLLKNFPVLSGAKGILRGTRDVIFRNIGNSLGAFGLFLDPGEMIFASAPLLAEMMRGRRTLRAGEISVLGARHEANVTPNALPGFPWLAWDPRLPYPEALEILYHEFHHLAREYGPPFLLPWVWPGPNLQFLGSANFMRDLHDLARNWTLCNVGEYCYAFGAVADDALDRLAASLLRQAGAQEFFDIDQEGPEIDAGIAVFIAHIDVGEG